MTYRDKDGRFAIDPSVNTYRLVGSYACDERCCMVGRDKRLPTSRARTHVRPMYQVLPEPIGDNVYREFDAERRTWVDEHGKPASAPPQALWEGSR